MLQLLSCKICLSFGIWLWVNALRACLMACHHAFFVNWKRHLIIAHTHLSPHSPHRIASTLSSPHWTRAWASFGMGAFTFVGLEAKLIGWKTKVQDMYIHTYICATTQAFCYFQTLLAHGLSLFHTFCWFRYWKCRFANSVTYIHTYIRNFSLITLDSELQLDNFGSGTLAQEPLLENSPICTSTEKNNHLHRYQRCCAPA